MHSVFSELLQRLFVILRDSIIEREREYLQIIGNQQTLKRERERDSRLKRQFVTAIACVDFANRLTHTHTLPIALKNQARSVSCLRFDILGKWMIAG